MAKIIGEAFRVIEESQPNIIIAALLSVVGEWAVQSTMNTSACRIIPGHGHMRRL